jgi:hypothetical protein
MMKFSCLRDFFHLASFLALASLSYGQTTCPSNFEVCSNIPEFSLSGGQPAGGTHSGTGVSAGNFSPALAGVGTKVITYTFTDTNNQTTSCQFNIKVNPAPEVGCILGFSFICDKSPRELIGCSASISPDEPLDIVWTGPGVTGNSVSGYYFDPTVAGPGLHAFTMTATNASGCTASNPYQEGVETDYEVSCPPSQSFTVLDPPFTLTGGVVIQGTVGEWSSDENGPIPPDARAVYSGPGVTTSTRMFDPAAAGEGIHTITYTYHGGNCPPASCTYELKSIAMPVKLISFKAENTESTVRLKWQISEQANFSHFEIQRSSNPEKEFAKVGSVGGDADKAAYEYIDKQIISPAPLYYRLKMVDNDGSFAYSKIVWVLGTGSEKLVVSPNPASDEIHINSPYQLSEMVIMNTSGIEVLSKKLTTNSTSLPQLPKGIYLLKVKTKTGNVLFSKLLIE